MIYAPNICLQVTCDMLTIKCYKQACRAYCVVVSTAAFHHKVLGSFLGVGGLKETKLFLPHPLVKHSIVESLRDREVACSASDLKGLNF